MILAPRDLTSDHSTWPSFEHQPCRVDRLRSRTTSSVPVAVVGGEGVLAMGCAGQTPSGHWTAQCHAKAAQCQVLACATTRMLSACVPSGPPVGDLAQIFFNIQPLRVKLFTVWGEKQGSRYVAGRVVKTRITNEPHWRSHSRWHRPRPAQRRGPPAAASTCGA